MRADKEAAIKERFDSLSILSEVAHQRPIHVYQPPSVRLRWSLLFRVYYTGGAPLTVTDIVPAPPPVVMPDGRTVRLMRVRKPKA